MSRAHLPYYEDPATHALRCSNCDKIMEWKVWIEEKRGIRYEVRGMKCPECGASKEEAAVLLGNEGSD